MQMFLWWACFGVFCHASPGQSFYHTDDEAGYAADTIRPSEDKHLQQLVEKYGYLRLLRKGIITDNKDVNPEFREIIDSMQTSEDWFQFVFDTTKGKPGAVEFKNRMVYVRIIDPGTSLGTKDGIAGILFEEAWHVKQFLKGEVIFQCRDTQYCMQIPCHDTNWSSASNIWKEVEAKKFVISQFEIMPTYYTGERNRFTVLYFLNALPNDSARARYLLYGWTQGRVRIKKKKKWPVAEPLYPEFKYTSVTNPNTGEKRIKTGCYLAYPKRTQ